MTVLAGVRKRYRLGGPWVLDGVDLELTPGTLIRVLGGNGTGKSTLLRLAAGVGRPSRGSIGGRPVTGYVPERFPPALPFLALDYLVHVGRVHGMGGAAARTRGGELLDLLGAAGFAGTRMRELSKGTAQKVAVAQALLARPGLLVLDEAWTGLDAAARSVLDAQVDQRVAAGACVLFVDHDPARLARRPMQVFRLERGRLVDVPAGERTAGEREVRAGERDVGIELDGLPADRPDDVRALLALPGTVPLVVSAEGRVRIRVPVEDSDDALRRALAVGPAVHVRRLVELAGPSQSVEPVEVEPVDVEPDEVERDAAEPVEPDEVERGGSVGREQA